MIYKQDERKYHTYQEKSIDKMDQIKEDKSKEKIFNTKARWNHFKFQICWKKIEWVYPKKRNIKKNPLCSSTHEFYTKYGKQAYHFVVHS